LAGKKAYCPECRGWGALFVQSVERTGDGDILRRGDFTRKTCEKCAGTGYPPSDGPARGMNPPVLEKADDHATPEPGAAPTPPKRKLGHVARRVSAQVDAGISVDETEHDV